MIKNKHLIAKAKNELNKKMKYHHSSYTFHQKTTDIIHIL